MRSGLAMAMRIESKLCGVLTCPKTFISSFIVPLLRRGAGYPINHSVRTLLKLDIEAERMQLLHEDVEGLGDAGLEVVVAADDRLVDLGAAGHVIRLDREHLLQRVGGAVGLEGPHLHLAEALAAELRLAAQRLLGDEAV